MVRHAAAVVVALCLAPTALWAQSTTFTVNADSANVYKTPSTGSPVIGKAVRGTVFEVTRELGSWVKVAWATAQDGVGYIHVSMGSIAHGTASDTNRAVDNLPARPASQSTSRATPRAQTERADPRNQSPSSPRGRQPALPPRGAQPPSAIRDQYVTPPTHLLGLGGLIDPSGSGFGGTARVWSRNQLGLQVEVSRYSLSSAAAPGHVTSVQFGPSILYSLKDHVTDYVWLRPHFGAGAGLRHQTLSGVTPVGDSTSDNSLGLQAFGGSELTFPSVPRFAVGADLGYRWSRTPFAGFDPGGLAFSLSAHWYVK